MKTIPSKNKQKQNNNNGKKEQKKGEKNEMEKDSIICKLLKSKFIFNALTKVKIAWIEFVNWRVQISMPTKTTYIKQRQNTHTYTKPKKHWRTLLDHDFNSYLTYGLLKFRRISIISLAFSDDLPKKSTPEIVLKLNDTVFVNSGSLTLKPNSRKKRAGSYSFAY